ncbi:hypothetical protein C8R43DRAFT_953664 [Mycena crocata]|nr:hypothetical protein C8R43DRAFT_953664 [Mycena crocata]
MSPTTPRTAVSIDLLEIYPLAAALHTIYDHRGFRVLSQRNPGVVAKDPFRAGLTQAVQSYSNLQGRLQARLDAALAAAAEALFPQPVVEAPLASEPPTASEAPDGNTSSDRTTENQPAPGQSPPPTSGPTPTPSQPPKLTPGRASRRMQEICPTCFALDRWGRPLLEGGDVQVGADGDGPISYDPSLFVSKEKVDAVRARIENARGKKRSDFTPAIPSEAIDACLSSRDAANEKKQKADPNGCGERAVQAGGGGALMLGSHTTASVPAVPPFHRSADLIRPDGDLADLPSPSGDNSTIFNRETRHTNLPEQATIIQCYDGACVTEHSINLYPILSEGFHERVGFVINAMHAYRHQWICQLNSRHIWMIDRYAAFINAEGRHNLGDWITHQQTTNIPWKLTTARQTLIDCRVPMPELRRNWAEQKAAQTSARSCVAHLDAETDKLTVAYAGISCQKRQCFDHVTIQLLAFLGSNTPGRNGREVSTRFNALTDSIWTKEETGYTQPIGALKPGYGAFQPRVYTSSSLFVGRNFTGLYRFYWNGTTGTERDLRNETELGWEDLDSVGRILAIGFWDYTINKLQIRACGFLLHEPPNNNKDFDFGLA